MKKTLLKKFSYQVECDSYAKMVTEIINNEEGLKVFHGRNYVVVTGSERQINELYNILP